MSFTATLIVLVRLKVVSTLFTITTMDSWVILVEPIVWKSSSGDGNSSRRSSLTVVQVDLSGSSGMLIDLGICPFKCSSLGLISIITRSLGSRFLFS